MATFCSLPQGIVQTVPTSWDRTSMLHAEGKEKGRDFEHM